MPKKSKSKINSGNIALTQGLSSSTSVKDINDRLSNLDEFANSISNYLSHNGVDYIDVSNTPLNIPSIVYEGSSQSKKSKTISPISINQITFGTYVLEDMNPAEKDRAKRLSEKNYIVAKDISKSIKEIAKNTKPKVDQDTSIKKQNQILTGIASAVKKQKKDKKVPSLSDISGALDGSSGKSSLVSKFLNKLSDWMLKYWIGKKLIGGSIKAVKWFFKKGIPGLWKGVKYAAKIGLKGAKMWLFAPYYLAKGSIKGVSKISTVVSERMVQFGKWLKNPETWKRLKAIVTKPLELIKPKNIVKGIKTLFTGDILKLFPSKLKWVASAGMIGLAVVGAYYFGKYVFGVDMDDYAEMFKSIKEGVLDLTVVKEISEWWKNFSLKAAWMNMTTYADAFWRNLVDDPVYTIRKVAKDLFESWFGTWKGIGHFVSSLYDEITYKLGIRFERWGLKESHKKYPFSDAVSAVLTKIGNLLTGNNQSLKAISDTINYNLDKGLQKKEEISKNLYLSKTDYTTSAEYKSLLKKLQNKLNSAKTTEEKQAIMEWFTAERNALKVKFDKTKTSLSYNEWKKTANARKEVMNIFSKTKEYKKVQEDRKNYVFDEELGVWIKRKTKLKPKKEQTVKLDAKSKELLAQGIKDVDNLTQELYLKINTGKATDEEKALFIRYKLQYESLTGFRWRPKTKVVSKTTDYIVKKAKSSYNALEPKTKQLIEKGAKTASNIGAAILSPGLEPTVNAIKNTIGSGTSNSQNSQNSQNQNSNNSINAPADAGLSKAMAVVKYNESKGRYNLVVVLADGAGITFGAYQITENSGILRKYVCAMAQAGVTGAVERCRMFGRSHYNGDHSDLKRWLGSVGNMDVSKKIQDNIFYENFYLPAKKLASAYNITDPIAVIHIIDHTLNAGAGGARRMLRKATGTSAADIAAARMRDYRSLKGWGKFHKSWTNRVVYISKLSGMSTADINNMLSSGSGGAGFGMSSNSGSSGSSGSSWAGYSWFKQVANAVTGYVATATGMNLSTAMGTPGGTDSSIGADLGPGSQGYSGKVTEIYRGWDKTDPNLKKFFVDFQAYILKTVGCKITIGETWRSPERQKWLYASGRTRNGPIVTKTLNSRHIIGKAIDIVVPKKCATRVRAELKKFIAEKGTMYGMKPGDALLGEWDPFHIQLPRNGGSSSVSKYTTSPTTIQSNATDSTFISGMGMVPNGTDSMNNINNMINNLTGQVQGLQSKMNELSKEELQKQRSELHGELSITCLS